MGHEVTIVERKWMDTSEEVMDGIRFKRFNLRLGSNMPGEEVPYKIITSPKLMRFILDKVDFAIKCTNI